MNRDQDHGYNLAVGEPVFLQKLIARRNIRLTSFSVATSFPYPSPAGDPMLLEELGWMYPGKHVVVTQGAKGGLFALLCVLKQMYLDQGFTVLNNVQHETSVHWPTHRTLTGLAGLHWREKTIAETSGPGIYLGTSPNNPDGTITLPMSSWDIWDAAYASPIYGWDGIVPHSVSSTFSAAKLYGLSGYRVGWVVTGNEDVAKRLKIFIEATSSGVSRIAQKSLACLLKYWRNEPKDQFDFHIDARAELLSTAKVVMRMERAFDVVEGLPISGTGMYAWVRLRDRERFDRALGEAHARVLGGEFCGATADWVRISCGLGIEKTSQAAEAINLAYTLL